MHYKYIYSLTGLVAIFLAHITLSFAGDIPAAQLYKDNCAVCHGASGNGKGGMASRLTPPPADFTKPQVIVDLSRERIIESITNGRKGTAMQAWNARFTPGEIEGLADYIRDELMNIRTKSLTAELPEHLQRGERIYQGNCSVCHGDYGETGVWTRSSMDTAPRNFTADFSKKVLTRVRMIESVTRGRPGTAMMPYRSKLSKEEIDLVVDYIRVVLMKYPIEQVEAEAEAMAKGEVVDFDQTDFMSRPIPNNLMGDAKLGRELYLKNCVPCHGKNGDGQGPRAYFINPKPRNFVSEDTRRALNRPKIFDAVTKGLQGSVMPAWGKVMSDQQIANITEFVFWNFIVGDPGKANQSALETPQQKKN